MNNSRRRDIRRAAALLEQVRELLSEAHSIVEDAAAEEQDYVDNMPENLQQSERYYTAEQAASTLQEAADAIGEIDIDELVGRLEEACE